MSIQEIAVFIIIIGCVIFVGRRIYRTFTNICHHKSQCDSCISDCKLRKEMQHKKQMHEKKRS